MKYHKAIDYTDNMLFFGGMKTGKIIAYNPLT